MLAERKRFPAERIRSWIAATPTVRPWLSVNHDHHDLRHFTARHDRAALDIYWRFIREFRVQLATKEWRQLLFILIPAQSDCQGSPCPGIIFGGQHSIAHPEATV